MPDTNDPYSRPINATRPDARLVGEHYGRLATDKARSHAAGPVAAAGVRALPSVVPVDMDALARARAEGKLEKKVPKQRKPEPEPEAATPSPDVTSPSADEPYVEYTHIEDAPEPPITEEDLFG